MKTKSPTTDDLLRALTDEQAREIVRRLAAEKGVIAEKVAATVREVVAAVEIEAVADEVFCALDLIDVQDCWDRAGESRDGYTSPDEAAMELVEEELQPFFEQVDRYHNLHMANQQRDYCMAVMLGLYRYAQESESEFKDWCDDMPLERARYLLDRWRKRIAAPASRAAMDRFIRQCCPAWKTCLLLR